MKKYILFDNDGVLVDTERWYFEANKKALKELGLILEFERYMDIMTRGSSSWEIAFEAGVSKEIVDKQRVKRDSYYQNFLLTKDIEIPKVKNVLKELSNSYKMAIVTTSRREDFMIINQKSGIPSFMDFVLCVEDYERAKPYPDPYLKAIQNFNCKKEEAIVVEDSQRGLSSAVNAKIDCIVVKNEFTKTQDFSKATHHIDSLEELLNLL